MFPAFRPRIRSLCLSVGIRRGFAVESWNSLSFSSWSSEREQNLTMATSSNFFDAVTLKEIGTRMAAEAAREGVFSVSARRVNPFTETNSSITFGQSTAATSILRPTGEGSNSTRGVIGHTRISRHSFGLPELSKGHAVNTKVSGDSSLGRPSTGSATSSFVLRTPPQMTIPVLPSAHFDRPPVIAAIGGQTRLNSSRWSQGCLNHDAEETKEGSEETDEDGAVDDDEEVSEEQEQQEDVSLNNASSLSQIRRRLSCVEATYKAECVKWHTFQVENRSRWVKSQQEHQAATAASIPLLEQGSMALTKAKDALDEAIVKYEAAAPCCKESAFSTALEAECRYVCAYLKLEQLVTSICDPIDERLAVAKTSFHLDCAKFTKGWIEATEARDNGIKQAKVDEALASKDREIGDSKKKILTMRKDVQQLEREKRELVERITRLEKSEQSAKADAQELAEGKERADQKTREVVSRAREEVARAQEAEAAAKRSAREAAEAAERRVREAEVAAEERVEKDRVTAGRMAKKAREAAEKCVRKIEEAAERRIREVQHAAEERVRDAEKRAEEAKYWKDVGDYGTDSDADSESVDTSANLQSTPHIDDFSFEQLDDASTGTLLTTL